METLPITLQTVVDLLPNVDSAMLWSMTGEALRTFGDIPTVADFETLTVPGLRALGIEAVLCALPEDDIALREMIAKRLRHGVRVPLIETLLPPEDQEDDTENADNWDKHQTAHIMGGTIVSELPEDIAELRTLGEYAILLKRASAKGKRLVHRDALLLRFAAFAAAYPTRLVTGQPKDAFRRECLRLLFAQIGGKQTTFLHRRLRIVAQMFEYANPSQAFSVLREIALEILDLPNPIHNALHDTECTLDPIERRELIYLARAGTLTLKILAVRRLHSETEYREAQDTLHQLEFHSHLWVRHAALQH